MNNNKDNTMNNKVNTMNNNMDNTMNNNKVNTMNNNMDNTINNNKVNTMNNNMDNSLNNNMDNTMKSNNDYTMNNNKDYGLSKTEFTDDFSKTINMDYPNGSSTDVDESIPEESGFRFTRPDRLNQLCGKTCRFKERQTCSLNYEPKCKRQCKVIQDYKRVVWDANLCGLSITKSVVPIVKCTEWMHAVENLEFITKEILCQMEKYARTNPDRLIEYTSTQLYTWCSKVSDCDQKPERFIVNTLIQSISSYVATTIHEQRISDLTAHFISKFHTWKLEASRIAKLHQLKIDSLQKMFQGPTSAINVFPILQELTRVKSMPLIPGKAKEEFQRVVLDMRLTAIKERIGYILNTFDKLMDFRVKVLLSQLIVPEEDINGQNIVTYQDMENQYEQIMTHVRKLINKNILKGQAHSELKKILVKLGIDIGMNQIQSFRIGITIAELTQQLIAKKEATFNIQKPQDCDISLCDRSITDSVCLYGCECTIMTRGRQCTVKVSNCKQTTTVKKLSTQEIIGQLRERNAARTICYTQAACTELSTIGGKAFPAGGFTFRSRYSPNTKLCQLKIEGMRTTSPDCGNGCEYTQLQYLQPEDVARMAATPRGAVFKVPDCNVCASYCNQDTAISSCGHRFSCTYRSNCWGRSCTCIVKHQCLGLQINFRSAQKSSEDDSEEETINIPKVEPVVTEGEKVLKNKKEEAKEAKNRMAPR